MPASVALKKLSYTTPDNQPLFDGLDLAFGPQRTGLIGRNGTGKSTLLRLIAGELPAANGSVSVTGSIGMLRQSVQVDGGETVAKGWESPKISSAWRGSRRKRAASTTPARRTGRCPSG